MEKHAYLIMAHNNFQTLYRLLKELDHPLNDIYLHIDKKSKNVDVKMLKTAVNESGLFFVPRINVYWGTISQIKCELKLLKIATKKQYQYYHLISGNDFPLKSQEEIHRLLKNRNDLFLTCFRNGEVGDEFFDKIKLFYPFHRFVGKGFFDGNSSRDKVGRKLAYWQLRLTEIQKAHNINRIKKYNIKFYKGDQWFSITHDFAEYVLGKQKEIIRMYFLTDAPDEIFMPTLAMNSVFAERVMNDSLRLIDWQRGTPYEFRLSDLDELKSSEAFFARKISFENDPILVEALIEHLHKMKEDDN